MKSIWRKLVPLTTMCLTRRGFRVRAICNLSESDTHVIWRVFFCGRSVKGLSETRALDDAARTKAFGVRAICILSQSDTRIIWRVLFGGRFVKGMSETCHFDDAVCKRGFRVGQYVFE